MHEAQTPKKVLIIIGHSEGSKNKNGAYFSSMLQKAIGDDYIIDYAVLRDFVYVLGKDEQDIYDPVRNLSIKDYNFVMFRNLRGDRIRSSAIASLLNDNSIPFIDTNITPGPWAKYNSQAIRKSAGMNFIASVTARYELLLKTIEQDNLPFLYPIIIKDNNGKKGHNNFIAHLKQDAISIIKEHKDIDFIIQEYIPNDGDYRFIVMGGTIQLAIYRQAKEGSHLNNTSQGASAKLIAVDEIDEVVRQDVIKAASLEHVDIAGVDVMFDKRNQKHYVIEVNASPQLVTGMYPEAKVDALAHYLKGEL